MKLVAARFATMNCPVVAVFLQALRLVCIIFLGGTAGFVRSHAAVVSWMCNAKIT